MSSFTFLSNIGVVGRRRRRLSGFYFCNGNRSFPFEQLPCVCGNTVGVFRVGFLGNLRCSLCCIGRSLSCGPRKTATRRYFRRRAPFCHYHNRFIVFVGMSRDVSNHKLGKPWPHQIRLDLFDVHTSLRNCVKKRVDKMLRGNWSCAWQIVG